MEIGASSISEIAYAWLCNHPSNIMPIAGSKDIARIIEAKNALDIKLTRKQWFKILDANRGYEVPEFFKRGWFMINLIRNLKKLKQLEHINQKI